MAPLNELAEGGGGLRPGGVRELLDGLNDIPDSAINHYPHANASGTTLTDNVGSNDGTISGSTWITNNWIESAALNHDATDDVVTFDYVSDIGLNTGFSVAITIRSSDVNQSTGVVYNNAVGGGSTENAAISVENGSVRVGVYDGSAWTGAASGSITDNTKYRVFWSYDAGASTLWINGSEQTGTNTPTGNDNQGMSIADDTSGAGNRAFLGDTDDLILMNAAETSSTMDEDYNRQPWS